MVFVHPMKKHVNIVFPHMQCILVEEWYQGLASSRICLEVLLVPCMRHATRKNQVHHHPYTWIPSYKDAFRPSQRKPNIEHNFPKVVGARYILEQTTAWYHIPARRFIGI